MAGPGRGHTPTRLGLIRKPLDKPMSRLIHYLSGANFEYSAAEHRPRRRRQGHGAWPRATAVRGGGLGRGQVSRVLHTHHTPQASRAQPLPCTLLAAQAQRPLRQQSVWRRCWCAGAAVATLHGGLRQTCERRPPDPRGAFVGAWLSERSPPCAQVSRCTCSSRTMRKAAG